MTTGAKAPRLEQLEHWDEIELRLRWRWTPERTARWHAERWPTEPGPAVRTMYRFLKKKTAAWFVSMLTQAELGTDVLPRLNVLQEQAHAIETMKLRVRTMLEDSGAPAAEIRAHLELLNRTLESHARLQQEFGLELKTGPATQRGGTSSDPGEVEGAAFAVLVRRIITAPEDEFRPILHTIFGPPGPKPTATNGTHAHG
jgi:hypothetical protein